MKNYVIALALSIFLLSNLVLAEYNSVTVTFQATRDKTVTGQVTWFIKERGSDNFAPFKCDEATPLTLPPNGEGKSTCKSDKNFPSVESGPHTVRAVFMGEQIEKSYGKAARCEVVGGKCRIAFGCGKDKDLGISCGFGQKCCDSTKLTTKSADDCASCYGTVSVGFYKMNNCEHDTCDNIPGCVYYPGSHLSLNPINVIAGSEVGDCKSCQSEGFTSCEKITDERICKDEATNCCLYCSWKKTKEGLGGLGDKWGCVTEPGYEKGVPSPFCQIGKTGLRVQSASQSSAGTFQITDREGDSGDKADSSKQNPAQFFYRKCEDGTNSNNDIPITSGGINLPALVREADGYAYYCFVAKDASGKVIENAEWENQVDGAKTFQDCLSGLPEFENPGGVNPFYMHGGKEVEGGVYKFGVLGPDKIGFKVKGAIVYNIRFGDLKDCEKLLEEDRGSGPQTSSTGNPTIKCTTKSSSQYECTLYNSGGDKVTGEIEWTQTEEAGGPCELIKGSTLGIKVSKAGTCVIYAKWSGKTASYTMDVDPGSTSGQSGSITIGFMLNGQFFGLLDKDEISTGEKTYYARKQGSTANLQVVWESYPSQVCTVPESATTEGKVIAKEAGTCNLNAQYSENGNFIEKAISIKVTGTEPDSSGQDSTEKNCRDDLSSYGCSDGFFCFLKGTSYTSKQLSDHIQANSQIMKDYLHWDYSSDQGEIDKGCVKYDKSELGDKGVYGYFTIDVKKTGLN